MIKGSEAFLAIFPSVDRNIGTRTHFLFQRLGRDSVRHSPRLIIANGICIAILRMSVIIMRWQ